MEAREETLKKRKISVPSEGYVCKICNVSGHWVQQCPLKKKQKKLKANPDHIHVPGVDPSQADIEKARELQKIKPPKCFCGETSRLKKVKRSNVSGKDSRAIGKYFFFCSKGKADATKCNFAKPVKDTVGSNERNKVVIASNTGNVKSSDKNNNARVGDEEDGRSRDTTDDLDAPGDEG